VPPPPTPLPHTSYVHACTNPSAPCWTCGMLLWFCAARLFPLMRWVPLSSCVPDNEFFKTAYVDDAKTDTMEVRFFALAFQQAEFERVVNGDLAFTTISMLFVWCYIWYHTTSLWLTATGACVCVLCTCDGRVRGFGTPLCKCCSFPPSSPSRVCWCRAAMAQIMMSLPVAFFICASRLRACMGVFVRCASRPRYEPLTVSCAVATQTASFLESSSTRNCTCWPFSWCWVWVRMMCSCLLTGGSKVLPSSTETSTGSVGCAMWLGGCSWLLVVVGDT